LKAFNQWAADYDLWMHLKVGEQILRAGSVFMTDQWSFTAPGATVIDHEWLVHVIMAGLFQWAGDTGVMLWRAGMVIAIAVSIFLLVRRSGRRFHPAAMPILLAAAAIILGPGLSFRPQLITYLGLIAVLVLAHPDRGEITPAGCGALIGIFWLWANAHGGFALGLVVWGWLRLIGLIDHPARWKQWRWGSMTLAPALVTLLTPHGIGLWRFIWAELSNPISARFITEWRPFSFAPREWPFLLGVITLFGFAWARRRRLQVAQAGLAAMGIALGLASVRHTPLLAILAMPLAARMAGSDSRGTGRRRSSGRLPARAGMHLLTAGLIAALALIVGIRGMSAPWGITADRDPLPITSVALLRSNAIAGRLWVPLHWGAYAVYHLNPAVTVSIDGRWAMVYPRSVMADHEAFSHSGDDGRWKTILERYGAQMVLVAPDTPVAASMAGDPDWVLILKEASAGLFFHRSFLKTLSHPLAPPSRPTTAWP